MDKLLVRIIKYDFKKYHIGDEMKGKFYIWHIIAILVLASIVNVVAVAKKSSGNNGDSNVGQLFLFEKDPETWEIIEYGAWGKMKYNVSGPEFVFQFIGHRLEPGLSYSLIYYPDPWPGNGLILLGEAIADKGGKIKIKNSLITCSLPIEIDDNHPDGAKIWLVLSEDIDLRMQCMVDWNPIEYLFENNLITFQDTSGRR